jgi:hypothetical protein
MHLGSDARVECATYSETKPILCVDGVSMYLALTPEGKFVESFDVANARALVEAAKVYLSECERLHAQHTDTDADTGRAA